jgi:hypothetical protein
MNKRLAFSLALMTITLLASCTPEQIDSAIRACQEDPACYVIIDDAIDDELSSRGITGGTMTNLELESVYEFFDEFLLTESGLVTPGLIALLAGYGYPDNDLYYVQRMLYHDDSTGLPNDLFDFESFNPDFKQRVIFQGDKYLIYKVGNQQFRFEAYRSRSYILTIDLELEAFYWNDVKFITPSLMLNRLENNYYNSSNTLIIEDDYMIVESFTEETFTEYNLGQFSSGSLGVYDRSTHDYFAINPGFTIYSDYFEGYLSLEQREGISPIRTYLFDITETYDGPLESFISYLNTSSTVSVRTNEGIVMDPTLLTDMEALFARIPNYTFTYYVNHFSS